MRSRSRSRRRGSGSAASILKKMSQTVKKVYLANPDDYDLSKIVAAEKGPHKGKVTKTQLEAARRT